MKKILIIMLLLSAITQAQNTDSEIIGTWKIDLRPTPDAKAYYQEFEVRTIKNKQITGKFYGSTIKKGLINKEWSKIYFAFSTSDNTHTYYHSGYLENGKVHGISYCPARNFTAPWKGEKKKD